MAEPEVTVKETTEEKQAEGQKEPGQWEGFDKRFRRPEDELFDISSIEPLREELVEEGIRKLVIQEGTSSKFV